MEFSEYTEIKGFAIELKKKPPFGAFYLTRLLWNLQVFGKTWQLILFYVFYWSFMPFLFVLDLFLLFFIIVLKVLKEILKHLFFAFVDVLKNFFSGFVFPTLRNISVLVSLVFIAIVLIFRFTEIKEFVLNLFETLIK